MLTDLIEKYCDLHQFYRFEGSRGVENFERLVRDMGSYGDSFSSPLRSFFEDNPGAIEAVVEWIMTSQVNEWKENLQEIVGEEA